MLGEIREVGRRVREMREILDISEEEMAKITGTERSEYQAIESGERDIGFTFLYRAAERFGIDMTELITGESPRLTGYTLVRHDQGLPIQRRQGFNYLNLAAQFRHRQAEPFLVTAPLDQQGEHAEIQLNQHDGQEMNYVLSGSLRMIVDQHEEILRPGDTIYYDASRPHGMVAVGGQPCQFLAVIIRVPTKTGGQ